MLVFSCYNIGVLQIADGFIFRMSLENVDKRASKYFRGEMQMYYPAVMCSLAHLKSQQYVKSRFLFQIFRPPFFSVRESRFHFSESPVSTGFYRVQMHFIWDTRGYASRPESAFAFSSKTFRFSWRFPTVIMLENKSIRNCEIPCFMHLTLLEMIRVVFGMLFFRTCSRISCFFHVVQIYSYSCGQDEWRCSDRWD